jgi:SAM-dependent methyltransferase
MPKFFDSSNDPSLQEDYNFEKYKKHNLDLPLHLGGHYNISNIDTGLFDYLKNKYDIKSMLEIGCGLGEQTDYAAKSGVDALGIDGDYTVKRSNNNFIICDLTQTTPRLDKNYDLVWSVEFVEHLHEKFIPNYMKLFQQGSYAVITHAFPGQKGHHHVNCQQSIYWIDVFYDYGFEYDSLETREMKKHSTMEYPWIQDGGLFFKKRKQ